MFRKHSITLILLLVVLWHTTSVGGTDTEITWNTLKNYLTYAYSAFCLEGLSNWTCYWCSPTFQAPPVIVTEIFASDGSQGVYGYVGYSSELIVISFRGSVSVSNWVRDGEFYQTSYPGIPDAYVHSGFYNAYTSVRDTVKPAVTRLRLLYPKLPILVTGHSLGAALSVLCALDLILDGHSDVQVWNFGQPRVGNDVFAQYFNQTVSVSFRVIHQQDLVPHLPPETLEYRHIAREVWFPKDGFNFVICDNSGEDPNCSNSTPLYEYDPNQHILYLGFNQHDGNTHNCPGSIIW